MPLNPIDHSRKLHDNANYSPPAAYASEEELKGRMRLPLALKETCSNFINNFDYGCGKNDSSIFSKNMNIFDQSISQYDPAVDQYSVKPNKSFDIMTCIDVLEHVSRQEIQNTFRNRRIDAKFSFSLLT